MRVPLRVIVPVAELEWDWDSARVPESVIVPLPVAVWECDSVRVPDRVIVPLPESLKVVPVLTVQGNARRRRAGRNGWRR